MGWGIAAAAVGRLLAKQGAKKVAEGAAKKGAEGVAKKGVTQALKSNGKTFLNGAQFGHLASSAGDGGDQGQAAAAQAPAADPYSDTRV